MVTYQFQLINLNNGNSDVFKQLESNRSSPGQPCCVFVPMVSNKAASPINRHTYTYVCIYIHTYGQLQLCCAVPTKMHVDCLCIFFIMVNVIVCLQVLLFELCKFKQKERNLHWMTILSVSVLLCEQHCANHSSGFEKG